MTLDTRISLYKLEVLCAVVEAGGVSRAAEILFVTQPVVSAHIRSLEERLDVELFSRVGRRVELTEQGKSVYRWAKACLALGQDMVRDLESSSAGADGKLTIAASRTVETYILPELLSQYREQVSWVRPSVLVCRSSARGLGTVRDGEVDFALALADGCDLPEDLDVELLRQEELILVAASSSAWPDHLQAAELEALPFVCAAEDSARRRLVDRRLSELGVLRRNIEFEVDHPAAVKELVRLGLGLAFLHRSSVLEDLAEGTLREVDLADLHIVTELALLSRPDRQLSRAQAAFLSCCREAFSAAFASPAAIAT